MANTDVKNRSLLKLVAGNIGKKIELFSFESILNYGTSVLNLSPYKKKLLE